MVNLPNRSFAIGNSNSSSSDLPMIIDQENQHRRYQNQPTHRNTLLAAEEINRSKTQITPENLAKDQQKRHQKCTVCGQVSSYQGKDLLMAMVEEQQQIQEHQQQPKYDDFMVQFNAGRNQEDSLFVSQGTAVKTVERCIRRVRKLRYELLQGGVLHSATQKYSAQHPSCARIIAPMLEEEVQVGSLLGSGGFSSVYEVTGFNLNQQLSASAYQRRPKGSKSRGINPMEEQSRQCIINSVRQPARIPDEMDPELKNAMQGVSVTSYAIKHLKKGLVKDPAMFQRAALDLAMEAQLLMAMDHPNIVALRGWSHLGVRGLISGRPTGFFVIMDRLPETLEDRIFQWREETGRIKSKLKRAVLFGKQKLTAKLDNLLGQRMEVLQQIASALEYMHSLRLLNRDVKAINIGFDNNGVVKLFDFGLSRIMPPPKEGFKDSYLMSRVGTKYYMAPEVHSKQPYNQSADTYSFGIVGWELMSLCSPRNVMGDYERNLQARGHEIPSFISAENVLPRCECWPSLVQDALRASLSMDPDRRPSMTQIRQALELAMNSIGYRKTPPPMNRRPSFRVDLTDRGSPSASENGSMFGASQGGDASTVDDRDRMAGGSVADSSTIDKGMASGISTANETRSETVSFLSRRSSSSAIVFSSEEKLSSTEEKASTIEVQEVPSPKPQAKVSSPLQHLHSQPTVSGDRTVYSANHAQAPAPSLPFNLESSAAGGGSVKSAPSALGARSGLGEPIAPSDPRWNSSWSTRQEHQLPQNPHGAHFNLEKLVAAEQQQRQQQQYMDVEMED